VLELLVRLTLAVIKFKGANLPGLLSLA